jgi:hypothetical protein
MTARSTAQRLPVKSPRVRSGTGGGSEEPSTPNQGMSLFFCLRFCRLMTVDSTIRSLIILRPAVGHGLMLLVMLLCNMRIE